MNPPLDSSYLKLCVSKIESKMKTRLLKSSLHPKRSFYVCIIVSVQTIQTNGIYSNSWISPIGNLEGFLFKIAQKLFLQFCFLFLLLFCFFILFIFEAASQCPVLTSGSGSLLKNYFKQCSVDHMQCQGSNPNQPSIKQASYQLHYLSPQFSSILQIK